MKINFQFVTVLSAGVDLIAATGDHHCDTNDLTRPAHFKAWRCVPSAPSSGIVPTGTKCYLECQNGFDPWSVQKRDFYTCRRNGWQPPYLNLRCPYNPPYWIQILLDDVAENKGNIADNAAHIAHNADNLQEYFKDTMNFDAIRLVDNAYLGGLAGPIPPVVGAIVVQINGNEGYVCDTDGTVNQHTADLLCQKVGAAGATNFFTQSPAGTYLPANLPLTVGQLSCPATALTLPECNSSGWGDLRNECDYDDVLWLECYYPAV